MKNLSLILNGVLVVAVGVLFYLHFSAPKTGAETVDMAADTTVVNAKGKAIVYVDTDSLMADYEYSKKVQADLLAKKTAMENRIKGAQSALENKYKEYQNKAAYLTPGEAQKAENDIKNMQIDGENLAYKLQSTFGIEAQGLQEGLFTKVESFIKDYAKANGHTYVIQTSRATGGPILYGDNKLNVTRDVINKLNELYKKEGGAPAPATK
jgi:outer membrane protein